MPRLLTVEEFDEIPNPPGGRYELRHGEAVLEIYPVRQHKDVQRLLRKLLEEMAHEQGIADTESPYRPLPEHGAPTWLTSAAAVTTASRSGWRDRRNW